jgi:hypothetical protein
MDIGGQFYCFDPKTGKIEHLGDLDELCGEKDMKVVSQVKAMSISSKWIRNYIFRHTWVIIDN